MLYYYYYLNLLAIEMDVACHRLIDMASDPCAEQGCRPLAQSFG